MLTSAFAFAETRPFHPGPDVGAVNARTGTVDQKIASFERFRKFRVAFRNAETGKIGEDHFPDAAVQLARPEPYPALRKELPGEVQKAGRVRDIADIFRLPASPKEDVFHFFSPVVLHVSALVYTAKGIFQLAPR